MDRDQMKYYQKLTEKIIEKPVGQRKQYLENLKKRDMEFYGRVENLMEFLSSNQDEVEDYAFRQIKRILDDIDDR